ncbi:Macrophage mannose receptor 1 [Bagarius yarrelli]|uniref:Macrophage mannose receptor 1 n=1 Tax=Bagarius yarrelli TaxID=175774 RepID=A0A556V4T1_BAGYA|nr:Macrophage mannose receptor 1 [Bagarius yarrelli]
MFAISPAKTKMDQAAFFLILLTGMFDISSSIPRQFYYVSELMTWQDAQSYCRANFVDLAIVGSLEDVTALQAAVKGPAPAYTGTVWIGLKRNWIWSTGDAFTYNPVWDVGQPNEGNGKSACLVLFSGAWGDYPCSSAFNFYCYDASPTATNKFPLISSSKNWTDAQLYCKQYYTDLALVNNAADAAVVSGTGWIGLISSQWSDGSFSSYRYWAGGNSESSLINKCSAMSMSNAAKWIGSDCSLKLPFACYGVPQYTGSQPTGPEIPRQYHYVDYRKTWLDAQAYCRLKFTDLATIDSINDVNKLMNEVTVGYSGSLWIGLKRSAQALWGWSRGDAPLGDYSSWEAGEPNGSGTCVVNINSFWRDYDCNVPLYFVCYKEKKVIKRTVIRITLSHSDTANLNDPLKLAAIFREFENKYKAWPWAGFGTLRWKVRSDGNVFVKERVTERMPKNKNRLSTPSQKCLGPFSYYGNGWWQLLNGLWRAVTATAG